MQRHASDRAGRKPVTSLAVASIATAVAIGLMFWARDAFQIRTLPERVMEWVLVFVPPRP